MKMMSTIWRVMITLAIVVILVALTTVSTLIFIRFQLR